MSNDFPRTCVTPSGEFTCGIHKPQFTTVNLRENDHIAVLGHHHDQETIDNADNFPESSLYSTSSMSVFEIPNAFPFMGATFVPKSDADRKVTHCNPFRKRQKRASEPATPNLLCDRDAPGAELQPRELLLALARTSTDPKLLAELAERSCRFTCDKETGMPSGMVYDETKVGGFRPAISDWHLFELVSNNPFLPDPYKQTMVLIPGAQGNSPIVGEFDRQGTHIWEYLRENSYIPWGHFAANMAHDAVRYKIKSLSQQDAIGLRHLYYQRMYVQLATDLGVAVPTRRRSLTGDELENLRLAVIRQIEESRERDSKLKFNATIWGQNFGFDLSPSGYRLNASHQQIHQQYALVPSCVSEFKVGKRPEASTIKTFVQGDLVAQFVKEYKESTNKDFFHTYLKAIGNNTRLDGRADKETSLVFYEDKNIIAFVPKAQRSQGEVQIMTKETYGNIVETDKEVRHSIDKAIMLVMMVLENLGAEMITAFEISKRFDNPHRDQRLLYCFLPKHPQSPGGFTEFQQRWIIGHYPEDFAETCRREAIKIDEVVKSQ